MKAAIEVCLFMTKLGRFLWVYCGKNMSIGFIFFCYALFKTVAVREKGGGAKNNNDDNSKACIYWTGIGCIRFQPFSTLAN